MPITDGQIQSLLHGDTPTTAKDVEIILGLCDDYNVRNNDIIIALKELHAGSESLVDLTKMLVATPLLVDAIQPVVDRILPLLDEAMVYECVAEQGITSAQVRASEDFQEMMQFYEIVATAMVLITIVENTVGLDNQAIADDLNEIADTFEDVLDQLADEQPTSKIKLTM